MKTLLSLLLLCGPLMAQTYPIKASANGRYFVDQHNVTWVMLADSAWDIIGNIPQSQWNTYLATRHSQKVNTIFFSALCNTYIFCTSANDGTAAFNGAKPFTRGTGTSNYDLATPNTSYWSQIDTLVDTICGYGMVALIDPTPSDTTWINTFVNNGPAKSFNYGAFIGNRYKDKPCVMWQHGNDFNGWNTDPTQNDVMHKVMLGIASADPNHIQTVELNGSPSWSNQDTLMSDVLGFDMCYSYLATYDCLLKSRASNPRTPAYMGESNYENENVIGGLPGPATALDIRLENYWAMTSGAAGVQYGNNPVYLFGENWVVALNTTATMQLQYILTLAAAVPISTLTPDSSHAVVTAGYGTYRGNNFNLEAENYCTTSWDGSTRSVTYCPKRATLTVALSQFRQSAVRARWFDPTAGTFATIGTFANSGTRNFSSPSNHVDGSDDWVLVLDPSPTLIRVTPTGMTTSRSEF